MSFDSDNTGNQTLPQELNKRNEYPFRHSGSIIRSLLTPRDTGWAPKHATQNEKIDDDAQRLYTRNIISTDYVWQEKLAEEDPVVLKNVRTRQPKCSKNIQTKIKKESSKQLTIIKTKIA